MPTSTNLEQLKLAIEEEKTVIYPVNIRSLIESKKVGILIGKRGLTIQHIQNNCGAHMFFYGEHANTCFRLLHIDGPPRCCTKALSHSFQRLIQGELRLEPIVSNLNPGQNEATGIYSCLE
jgi:hypothetical protein